MAQDEIKTPRDFPAVEEVLQDKNLAPVLALVPRPYAVLIIRERISFHKKKLLETSKPLTYAALTADIAEAVREAKKDEITKIINATGIVVHTNLGRAPLSESLFEAVKQTVTGYGNIEFDLHRGVRGQRGIACERYLALIAGAEAATVVNNCAAALFLMLNTLANRKHVLISRSELVQIGGGFRIPDILKKSGAKLREVGTTNITTIADYENNLDERVGLILKVHKSNFVQAGFTEEVPLTELVALGKKHSLPVINDLGSGVLIPTTDILGYTEPTVQQSVRQGAALTSFSGDKLLGGVQAGLIVGKEEFIKKIKKNPLFRTMRVDKIVFSMLEKLFTMYLNGSHMTEIKLWQILSVSEAELYRRAKKLVEELGSPAGVYVEATNAYVGGGALPESHLPSVGIVFDTQYKATTLMKKFRTYSPPIIGRIDNDRFIVDLKAVSEEELPTVRQAIEAIIKGAS